MALPQYKHKAYNVSIPKFQSRSQLSKRFKISGDIVDDLINNYIIESKHYLGIPVYNYKEFRQVLKLQLISLKELMNIHNIYAEKVNNIVKMNNLTIVTISVMKYVFINDIKDIDFDGKSKYDIELTDITSYEGQFVEDKNGYNIFKTTEGELIKCKLFNTSKIVSYKDSNSITGGSHPMDKNSEIFYII